MAGDNMEFDGVVESSCKGIFVIKVSDTHTVNCTLSGKIIQNGIRILLGDFVKISVSPYDTQKGRIIFRHKQQA